MSTNTCPQCNSENPADRLICETCGSPLPLEDIDAQPGKMDAFEDDVLGGLDDWLQELEDLPELEDESEITQVDDKDTSVPVKDLESSAATATEDGSEDLLNWLQEQEPDDEKIDEIEEAQKEIHSLPTTQPLTSYHEIDGIPEQLASEELPDWLESASKTANETFSVDEFGQDEPVLVDSKDDFQNDIVPRSPQVSSAAEPDSSLGETSVSSDQDAAAADWYSEMADTDLESALDEMLDHPAESSETSPGDEWLDLVDEMPIPDQMQPSLKVEDVAPDPQIDEGEVPDWLQALGPAGLGYVAGENESVETSGPLSGLSGAIPIATAAAVQERDQKVRHYTMSKEQQQQVALLRRLTSAGPEDATKKTESRTSDGFLSIRVILGLILLILVIVGWFLPPIESIFPWLSSPTVSEVTEAAHSAVESAAGSPVLVAFEYTPAMAGELDMVASAILSDLAQNNSPVIVVTQYAAGVPVSQGVVDELEELEYLNLGYLPGDATGLRLLGSCLSSAGSCEEIAGLSDAQGIQESIADVSLIVVLSGDRDGIVNWIEQVGSQTDLPMIAGITQGIQPIVNPYLKSNQIYGALEGMPAAATYEREYLDSEGLAAKSLTSVTLSQWFAIVAIVVGSIYYGLSGTLSSSGKKMGIR